MKIILPELGEGIEYATVAFWHVNVGDHVLRNADLVELTTDKATFTVPADCDGTVKEIYAQVGENVRIGASLADIEPQV